MSKIKFRLEKWEKALVFQVLEMDERFRYPKKDKHCSEQYEYKTKSGVIVRSNGSPGIYYYGGKEAISIFGMYISLPGIEEKKDNKISVVYFPSNEIRDEYVKQLLIELKDWADNWEGWGETESIKESSDGIFEF